MRNLGKDKFEKNVVDVADKVRSGARVVKNKVKYAAKNFGDKTEKIYDDLEMNYKKEELKEKLRK